MRSSFFDGNYCDFAKSPRMARSVRGRMNSGKAGAGGTSNATAISIRRERRKHQARRRNRRCATPERKTRWIYHTPDALHDDMTHYDGITRNDTVTDALKHFPSLFYGALLEILPNCQKWRGTSIAERIPGRRGRRTYQAQRRCQCARGCGKIGRDGDIGTSGTTNALCTVPPRYNSMTTGYVPASLSLFR